MLALHVSKSEQVSLVKMSTIQEYTNESTSRQWTNEETRLLVTTRLGYESQFVSGRRKKSVLWSCIYRDIKEIRENFFFSKDDCMKKFSNLLLTYNRIKKRNNKTGREATLWEFFKPFNDVYGTRHCITPPTNQLSSSITMTEECTDTGEECADTVDLDGNISLALEEHPARSTRKPKNEILAFLQKEAKEDEKRYEEYLKIEKMKVENEKEKIEIEREKVKEVRELKEILQKFLD